MERVNLGFVDDEHLVRMINRFLMPTGKKLSVENPVVFCETAAKQTVLATLPPYSPHGPTFSLVPPEPSYSSAQPIAGWIIDQWRNTEGSNTSVDANANTVRLHLPNDGNMAMGQALASTGYKGCRLRFSALLKGVGGALGQLYFRLDTRRNFIADRAFSEPLRGTTDWCHQSVEILVPSSTTRIMFGVMLVGPGSLSIRELQFEVLDDSNGNGASTRRELPSNMELATI